MASGSPNIFSQTWQSSQLKMFQWRGTLITVIMLWTMVTHTEGQLVDPPTLTPTVAPTLLPSEIPSLRPTLQPTSSPSSAPSLGPTNQPSFTPKLEPTFKPSGSPSQDPSSAPRQDPTGQPTLFPSSFLSLGARHNNLVIIRICDVTQNTPSQASEFKPL